jgi:hypothetical protein
MKKSGVLEHLLLGGLAVTAASAVNLACGGSVEGSAGGGGTASDSGGGASADAGSGFSASSGDGSQSGSSQPGNSGVTCTSKAGGTTGAECHVTATESCTDGSNYDVECSCTTGICTCLESTNSGGSSSGASSFDCPPGADCAAYGYAACGFPSTVDAGSTVGQPVQTAPSCPVGAGNCGQGTYGTWYGDGMGNGGGGCSLLPPVCATDATCACLFDAGIGRGCACTDGDAGVALCCN